MDKYFYRVYSIAYYELCAQNTRQYKKCYTPDYRLKTLLNDLSDVEINIIKLDKQINAEKITKEQYEVGRENWENKKRNLERDKVDILDDVVFPSFANLTFLVESIVDSPSVRKHFEKDLKALFFAKSSKNKHRQKSQQSIFERFTEACCNMALVNTKRKDKEIILDFRLILCWIMQRSIFFTMQAIGPYKFLDPNFAHKTMNVDMDRALAWTSEVSHQAWKQLHYDKVRPPQF